MTAKHKIINDPVYDGFMTIDDPVILEVIEHPYFQRLRRIKQLGMADLVYPGAVHTRFSHCLGALNLMCRTLNILKSKGVEITDEECRGAKLAILLHDIGHAPGSHVLEHTFVKDTHEVVTEAFMEHLNRQTNGELDLAIAIFKNKYHKHFLHQLVSSQLDMDRLDYLGRDSYFTGVREGIVGTDRIISMLNVHDDELVVDEKGIYSVEKFIISRRLMYWQVYMHKTVVAADLMLQIFFQRAIDMGKSFSTKTNIEYFLNSRIPITGSHMKEHQHICNEFARLDDSDLYFCMKENHNSDWVLSWFSKRLLQRNLVAVRFSDKPFPAEDIEALRQRVPQDVLHLDPTIKYEGWKDWMTNYFVGTGELHNRSYDFNDQEIKVLYKDGRCVPISEASDQLDRHFLEKQVTKYYLYYPKELDL
ncbi:MAG: HD domain-containing protein [Bacteroidales bacterium]|nr:HD domain-containing protein [Bacteroidales bacterium]